MAVGDNTLPTGVEVGKIVLAGFVCKARICYGTDVLLL